MTRRDIVSKFPNLSEKEYVELSEVIDYFEQQFAGIVDIIDNIDINNLDDIITVRDIAEKINKELY